MSTCTAAVTLPAVLRALRSGAAARDAHEVCGCMGIVAHALMRLSSRADVSDEADEVHSRTEEQRVPSRRSAARSAAGRVDAALTTLSLACAAANAHRHAATPCVHALRWLRLAVLWGRGHGLPVELLTGDRDLDPLRGDTRFQSLVLALGRTARSEEFARTSDSLLAALAWQVEEGDDVACEVSPAHALLCGRPIEASEGSSPLLADVVQALEGALASTDASLADGPPFALLLPLAGALAEERDGRGVAVRLLTQLAACPGHASLLLSELAAGRPAALRPIHALLAVPAPPSGEAHPIVAVFDRLLRAGGERAGDTLLTALLQSCVRLTESGRDFVSLSLAALARPGLGPALGVVGMRAALSAQPLRTWYALAEVAHHPTTPQEDGTVELGQALPCASDEAPRAAEGLLLLAQSLASTGSQAIVDELGGAAIALRCTRTTLSTFGAHAARVLLQDGPIGRRGLGASDNGGHALLSRPPAGVPAPWEATLAALYARLGKSAPLPPSMGHCVDAVVITFATVAAHACGILPRLLRLAEEGREEAAGGDSDDLFAHIWPAALRAGRRALPAIKAVAWLQAIYAATASCHDTAPIAADAAAHVHAAILGAAAPPSVQGVEEELGGGEAEAVLSLLGLPVGCDAGATQFAISVWLAGADPMGSPPTAVVADRVRRLALPLLRFAPVADPVDGNQAVAVCRHAAVLLAPALLPTQAGRGIGLSEDSLHAAIAALAAADGDADPAFIAECLSTVSSLPLGAAASLFPLLGEPGVDDAAEPRCASPRLPLSCAHRHRLRELVTSSLMRGLISDSVSPVEFEQRCAALAVLATYAPSIASAVIVGAVDPLCAGIRTTLSSSTATTDDNSLELVRSGGFWMSLRANEAAGSRFEALHSLSSAMRACWLSSTSTALMALRLADSALAHAVEGTADLASRLAACHFAALCLSCAQDGLEAADWAVLDVQRSDGASVCRLMDAALSLASAPAWAASVLTEDDAAVLLQCLPWLARLTGDMEVSVGGLLSFLASSTPLDFCLSDPTTGLATRRERLLDKALQRCLIGEVGASDGSRLYLRLLLVPHEDAAALSALEAELRCSRSAAAFTRPDEDEGVLVLLATFTHDAPGFPNASCAASGSVLFQPECRLVDEEPPLSLTLSPTRLSLWERAVLCMAVVPWLSAGSARAPESQIQRVHVPARISIQLQTRVSDPLNPEKTGAPEKAAAVSRLVRIELQCPTVLTPSGLTPVSGEALMDAVDAALDAADVEEDKREQALDRLAHGLMRARTSTWSVLQVLPDMEPAADAIPPVWLPLMDAPSEIAVNIARALATVPVSAGAGKSGSVACGAGLTIVSRFVPLDDAVLQRANVTCAPSVAGFPSPRLAAAAGSILRDLSGWSEQCASALMLHLIKALSGDSATAGAALSVLGGSAPLIIAGSTVCVPASVCRSLLPDGAVIVEGGGGPWVSARVQTVAYVSPAAAETLFFRLLCDGTADVGAPLPPAHVPMHMLGAMPPALVLRQPGEGDAGAPYVCPSVLPSSDVTSGCIRACSRLRVRCRQGRIITIGPVPLSLLVHSEEFGAPAALDREAPPPNPATGRPLPPMPVPSWWTRLVQHALAPDIISGIAGLARKAIASEDTRRICELSRVCAAMLAAAADATGSGRAGALVLTLLPEVAALQEWVSAALASEGAHRALAHVSTSLVVSVQRVHAEMQALAPPAGVPSPAAVDACATQGWICTRAESPPWMQHVDAQRREDDPRRATPTLLGGFSSTAFAAACSASATAAAGASVPSQNGGTGAVLESSARRFIQLVAGLPGQLVGAPSAAPAVGAVRAVDTVALHALAHSPTRLPLSHSCATEWAASVAVLRDVVQTRSAAECVLLADHTGGAFATCIISPEALALKQTARSAGVGTLAAKGSDEWLLPFTQAPDVLDPVWWHGAEDSTLTFELHVHSVERGQGLHAAVGLWSPTALSAPDGPFTHGAEWGPGSIALFSDGTVGHWTAFPDLSLLAQGTALHPRDSSEPLPPTCMIALACGAPIDVLDRTGAVAWRPAVIRAVSLLPVGDPAAWAPSTALATVRAHFLGWGAQWDETLEVCAGSPWTRATLVRAGDGWAPLVSEVQRLFACKAPAENTQVESDLPAGGSDASGADGAPIPAIAGAIPVVHRVAPPHHHTMGVPGPPPGFMLRTPCGPTWDSGERRVQMWWRPSGCLACAVDGGSSFLLPARFLGVPVPVAATALSTTAVRLLVSPSPASQPDCMAPREAHLAESLDACAAAHNRRCAAATADVTAMLDAVQPPGQSAQVRRVAPPRPKPCDCWRRHRAAIELADLCCPGIGLSAALMTLRLCGDDRAAAADWLFSHGASSGPSGPLAILGPRADAIFGPGTAVSLSPDAPLCSEGIPRACAGRSHFILYEPVRYAESGYDSPDCGRSLLEHTPASFGAVPPPAPGLTFPFVMAVPADASAPLEGGPERYAGRWAVIKRGGCTFTSKARRVQAAGAAGCILISDDEGVAFVPDAGAEDAADVTIPYVLIGRAAGELVTRLARGSASAGSEEATLTLKVGLAEPASSAGTTPAFLSLSSLRALDSSRAAALAALPAATPPGLAGALLWRTAARNAVAEEGLEPLAQLTVDAATLQLCHGSSHACEPGVDDGNDGLGVRGLIRPADVARGIRGRAEPKLVLGTAAVQALGRGTAATRIGQALRAAAAAGDALCDASGEDSEADSQAHPSGGAAAPPPTTTAPAVRTEWSEEFGGYSVPSSVYRPPQAPPLQTASSGPLSPNRHARSRTLSSGSSPALAAIAPLGAGGTPGSTAGSQDDFAAAAAAEESRWLASIELGLRLRHVAPPAIVSIIDLLRANDENSLAIARSMCEDVRLPIPPRPEPRAGGEPPPLSLDVAAAASSTARSAPHADSPLRTHRQPVPAGASHAASEALPASGNPDRPPSICGVDRASPLAELAGPILTPASVRVGLPVLLRYTLDEVHHWAAMVRLLLRVEPAPFLRVGAPVLAQREWAAGRATSMAGEGELGPAAAVGSLTVPFDDWGDSEVILATRVRPAQPSPSAGQEPQGPPASRVWQALPTASMLLHAAGDDVEAAMRSVDRVANAVGAAIVSAHPGRVVSCDLQAGSAFITWHAATLSLPLSHLCRLQSVPSAGVGIAPIASARACDLQLASRALDRASVCAAMLGVTAADDARLSAAVAPLGLGLAAGLEWCDVQLSFPAASAVVRAVMRGSRDLAGTLARMLGAPLHAATCLPDLLAVLDSAATGDTDARRAALHGLASGHVCVIQHAGPGDGTGRKSGPIDVYGAQGSRPPATLDVPAPLAVTAAVDVKGSEGAVGVFIGLVASPEASSPIGTAVYLTTAPPIEGAHQHQPAGDARPTGSAVGGGSASPPPLASLAPSATLHCYRGAGLHRDLSTTDPNWPAVLIPCDGRPTVRLWATFERAAGAASAPPQAGGASHSPCVALIPVSVEWAAALALAHCAVSAGAASAVVRVALPFVANASTPYPFRLPWLRVCASALLALTPGSAPGALSGLENELDALTEELDRLHGAPQSHTAAALTHLLAITRNLASPSTLMVSDRGPFDAALDAAWAVHDLRVLGRAWGEGARTPRGGTPTGMPVQSLGPVRAAHLAAFCSAAWLTESVGLHALESSWKASSVEQREAWAELAASDGASEVSLQASMAVLGQSLWGPSAEAELSVFVGALHAVLLTSGNAVDGSLNAEGGVSLRVPTVEAVAREFAAAAAHLGARRSNVGSPSVGLSSPTALASYPALARCVMEHGAPSLLLRYLLMRAVSRVLLPALGQLPVLLDSRSRSSGECCTGSPVALVSQLRLAVLPEVAEAWMRSVLKSSGVALRAQRQRIVLNRFAAVAPGTRETGARVPWRSSLLGQVAAALGRLPPVLLRQDGSAVPHLAFEVRLAGEKVIGENGPYREAFTAVATEVMSDGRVLLPLPSDQSMRVPLPRLPARLQGSRVPPQPPLRAGAPSPCDITVGAADALLSSLGVLIGCALRTGTRLPLALPSFVWKAAVGDGHSCLDACSLRWDRASSCLTPSLSRHAAGVSLGDLEALDSQLVRGTLLPMLHMQSEEGDEGAAKDEWETAFGRDGLTASTSVLLPTPRGGEAWTQLVLEMRPGGAEEPLPFADRAAYCAWAADAHLALYEDSTASLVAGLWRVVPRAALTLMPWSALESAVCGTPDVDVDMLARHTEYGSGTSALAPVMVAFWSLMRSADAAFRTRVVRFIFGVDRLPGTDSEWGRTGLRLLIKCTARPGVVLSRGGRMRAAVGGGVAPVATPPRPSYPGFLQEPAARGAPLPPAAGPPIRRVDEPVAGSVSPGSAPPRREGVVLTVAGTISSLAGYAAAPAGLTQAQVDGLLPTSDTCFGNLDLPSYSSLAVLAERLGLAVTATELDADDV